VIRWLLDRWHSRQRTLDMQILWPVCKEQADSLERAKAAFAFHAFHDRAWLCLGEQEIKRRINTLV